MDLWRIDGHLLRFLEEDVGFGDITTDGVFRGERIKAVMVAKEEGICAGLIFSIRVFQLLGKVEVLRSFKEGQRFEKGDVLLEMAGDGDIIMKGERLALNIAQKLSGIATLTRAFVERLEGTRVRILDTRKTTPGFRLFEKYAVRVGGGQNHRFTLGDMVLIKDNHKRMAGGIVEAIRRVKERVGPAHKIEVEVENLKELEEVLNWGVDVVMLDNFSPQMVKEAVAIIKDRAEVEVSGNITLENLRDYAIEGVDYVSSGSITHSARWLDMSIRVL